MDILSIMPQRTAAPPAVGSPPTRGKPDPAAAPDGPDPAKAPMGRPDGQKEAIGKGQTAHQNLLDLLKDLNPGSETPDWLGGKDVQAALAAVSLPPTLDDVVKALGALGVSLPAVSVGQPSPTADQFVGAVKSSPLPEEAKLAVAAWVRESFPATAVAADVISLGRPNPEPKPVDQFPVPTPQPGPKPHAESGPDPNADSAAGLSSAVLRRHARVGPDARAGSKPIKEVAASLSGKTAPAPPVAPVASETGVTLQVTGSPEASGQVLPAGLLQALNVTAVESEEASAVDEGVAKVAPKPGQRPAPTASSTERTVGPKPEQGVPDRTALGRPVPQPHAEAGDGPDRHAALGRPVQTANPLPLGRPEPHAEVGPTPKPKVELGKDDMLGKSGPAIGPSEAREGVKGQVDPSSVTNVRAEESELVLSMKAAPRESGDSDALDVVSTAPRSREAEPAAAMAAHQAASASKSEDRAPLPKETVDSVHRQIADRIETMVNGRRSGSVTVRLNPNDLGTITLTVKSIGSRVDTEIKASNEDVRLALQANRHDLVQNVESRGLTMNSFNVGQEAQPQGQGQEHRAAFDDAQRQANLRSATVSGPARPQAAVYRASTSGVDYLA